MGELRRRWDSSTVVLRCENRNFILTATVQYFITVMAILSSCGIQLSNEGYPELSRIALGMLVIAPENAKL